MTNNNPVMKAIDKELANIIRLEYQATKNLDAARSIKDELEYDINLYSIQMKALRNAKEELEAAWY